MPELFFRMYPVRLLWDSTTGLTAKRMRKQASHSITSGPIRSGADIRDGARYSNREGHSSRQSRNLSASALSEIDVYIIVDPDTTTESKTPNYIMPEDIKAIKKWVKKGGVLAILANDAPNCEFTHLNQLTKNFGMTFNHVTLHPVTGTNFEMGASKDFIDHPLFRDISKIYIKEVSDINLSGKAKAVLTENGKVLIAEAKYGKGYVFAIGDPWIYNEYIDHDRLPDSFENRKAAENLTDLLLGYTGKPIVLQTVSKEKSMEAMDTGK